MLARPPIASWITSRPTRQLHVRSRPRTKRCTLPWGCSRSVRVPPPSRRSSSASPPPTIHLRCVTTPCVERRYTPSIAVTAAVLVRAPRISGGRIKWAPGCECCVVTPALRPLDGRRHVVHVGGSICAIADSLNILLCPISTTFSFKHISRAKSEGECFIILAQEIIDLACQKRSRVSSILGEVIALIQSLSGVKGLSEN